MKIENGKPFVIHGKEYPFPVVGQEVYVRTSLYLSHGRDDFQGGKAHINEIVIHDKSDKILPCNVVNVTLAERPGWQYTWCPLWDAQNELKEKYGESCSVAHPDPDYHPSANEP